MYDSAEAGLIFCLKAFAQFKSDFASIPITGVVPDYTTIVAKCREVQLAVEEGPGGDEEHRELHARRSAEFFRQLYPYIDKLSDAREELNKLRIAYEASLLERAQAERDREQAARERELANRKSADEAQLNSRRHRQNIAIGAVSAFFGGLAVVLAYLALSPSRPAPAQATTAPPPALAAEVVPQNPPPDPSK